MTKKIVSLTIDGQKIDCPALQQVVGGRNAGNQNEQAWQALAESGIVSSLPAHAVICVLKDDRPYRQMTSESLAKGVTLVDELTTARKAISVIQHKLESLQTVFVTSPIVGYDPTQIASQLAAFAKAKK